MKDESTGSQLERSEAQERRLDFFNRFVYEILAPLYDAMDWLTLGVWWRLVRRALDYVPNGGRTLEIGFGPGKLHLRLAQKAALCVGVDLARAMCRLTQRRLRQAGLPIRITQGDALALPYPAEVFDQVVSTFAFTGMPDGARAMQEMARVTRAGGQVVLISIGEPSDSNKMGRFLAHLWERTGDLLYDQPSLMRAAGLSVRIYEEYGPGNHIRAIVGVKQPEGIDLLLRPT